MTDTTIHQDFGTKRTGRLSVNTKGIATFVRHCCLDYPHVDAAEQDRLAQLVHNIFPDATPGEIRGVLNGTRDWDISQRAELLIYAIR